MPLYAARRRLHQRAGMTTETLERGQFWFGGQPLRTPHMQPELRTAMSARCRLVMQTPPVGGCSFGAGKCGEGGGEGVRSGVRPEVANARTPERPNVETVEPSGPTDRQAAVWAWRDAHPEGTQAEMRADFEAQEISLPAAMPANVGTSGRVQSTG